MPPAPPVPALARENSQLTARSCKECRRRKLKCDRNIPCSSCVSRGLDDLCPDGIVNTKTVQLRAEVDRLQQRIQDLEIRLGRDPSKGELEPSIIRSPTENIPSTSPATDISSNRGASSSIHQNLPDDQWAPALGTLTLDKSGRARYVGSTAASEWLNQDHDANQMTEPNYVETSQQNSLQNMANFPLRNVSSSIYPFLHALLPPRERIDVLLDSYWYLYAFNYNVVSRSTMESYLEHVTNMNPWEEWSQDSHPHKLALIFMVLAMGSLVNPDTDRYKNEEAKTLFEAAEVALSISNFMKDHTIASVQTLHIMANYHVYDDRLRGGDRAWPLGGLAMRITQAMGLHRDGTKWGLPADIIEERRRLFWEIHTEETFQAHCFGRPGGFSSRHFDVECPEDDNSLPFSTIRYQLVRISSNVLDQVMVVHPPSYSLILDFHDQFVALEASLPADVRWNPATMPSPAANSSWAETSTADKETLFIALKRHTLSLNINESILFLLRTHFARALRENPSDPSKSRYSVAFQAVFSRCQTIIAIAQSLYTLHPTIALGHWFFWYHACSAAVCMASIPMIAPFSPYALQGWHELQNACQLFSAAGHQSKSSMASLALLLRLRRSAFDKMSGDRVSAFNQPFDFTVPSHHQHSVSSEVDESSHLMGLHTRLIERRSLGPPNPKAYSDGMQSPAQPIDNSQNMVVGQSSVPDVNVSDPNTHDFSFSLQPESLIHSDVTSQAMPFDFNLDQNTLAFLSSMRPDPNSLGPVPLDSQMNWNDLDFWLGTGVDFNDNELEHNQAQDEALT